MQQIINFLIRNKNFLLFSLLFILSIALTIRSHTFHNGSIVNSANFVSGNIYELKSNILSYFGLKKENKLLVDENIELRKQLDQFIPNTITSLVDSSHVNHKYIYASAEVINNNYGGTKNNLTINKGYNDSVRIDLGVISSKGIVGIVNNTSKNYATVQSILNTKSQINAKLKSSDHFGSLVWNTKDPNIVQLIDIPRLAIIKVGDTIVTGGMSTIFPKNILIGTVKEYLLEKDDNYYHLDIELFNDMTNIRNVYIIDNKDSKEIKSLEKEMEDAEE